MTLRTNMMTRWMRRAAYATTLGLGLTAFSLTPAGSRLAHPLGGVPSVAEACSPSVSNQQAIPYGTGTIITSFNYSCFSGQAAYLYIMDQNTGTQPPGTPYGFSLSGSSTQTVRVNNLTSGHNYSFYTCTGTSQYGGGVCTNTAYATAP